jgi:hypothetical protein
MMNDEVNVERLGVGKLLCTILKIKAYLLLFDEVNIT